jgi:hypothetical protein
VTDEDMEKARAIADGFVAAADTGDAWWSLPPTHQELVCRALLHAMPVKPAPLWRDIVKAAQERMGRELTLDELLTMAKDYKMTPEEIEQQCQSWCLQDMD